MKLNFEIGHSVLDILRFRPFLQHEHGLEGGLKPFAGFETFSTEIHPPILQPILPIESLRRTFFF
jgi:hypothetical protein